MKSGRFSLPALLLLAWCQSVLAADSAAGAPVQSGTPATANPARTKYEEHLGAEPVLNGVTIVDATDPKASRVNRVVENGDVLTDFNATPGPATDQPGRQAQIAELRARLAAGDKTAIEELRALLAEPHGNSPRVEMNSRGRLTPEEIRAKLADLRARAAAGDPTVTVTTGPNGEITRISTTSTRIITPSSPEEARAMVEELRARAAAGDPTVKFTTRAKVAPQRTTEMTEEERARRQSYIASHPELPERSRVQIAAGLFILAMKFEDVEQIMGPLQPAEGQLPADVVVAPDVSVYTAKESGRTVYVLFRDGKLVRR